MLNPGITRKSIAQLNFAWLAAAITGAVCATEASVEAAPWSVTLTRPPSDTGGSVYYGVGNAGPAGIVAVNSSSGTYYKPALFQNGGWVDLTSPDHGSGAVNAVMGDYQGGVAVTSSTGVEAGAAIWKGSAASFVSLHPVGVAQSQVNGLGPAQAVGQTVMNDGTTHAAVWSLVTRNWTDLDPAGTGWSIAQGTDGTHQVGDKERFVNGQWVDTAFMWSGTAESAVKLGGDDGSDAYAIVDGVAFGYKGFKPVLWRGSANAVESLLPSWGIDGSVFGAVDGVEVGTVGTATGNRPVAWFGTADSAFDLSTVLPPGVSLWSTLLSVTRIGDQIYITGNGSDDTGSYNIVWSTVVPEPTAATTIVAMVMIALGRRRHS